MADLAHLPADLSLSTLIFRRRVAAGLTQAELAVKLKVTQGTVSAWESASQRPYPSQFPKLAKALRIDVLELARLVAPRAPKPEAAELAHAH